MDRFEFFNLVRIVYMPKKHHGNTPEPIGAREEAFLEFWNILRSLV